MISVEVYLIDKDTLGLGYWFKISFETLFLLYCLFVSYYLSVLSFHPYYLGKSLLVSHINTLNIKWTIYPLSIVVIQMEFYFSFKTILILKIIGRAFYTLYFGYYLINTKEHFRFSKYKYIYFVKAMCFSSCIIEFCFIYDKKNDCQILNSTFLIIVMKLFIEIVLSMIILIFLKKIEEFNILSVFEDNDQYNAKVEYNDCIVLNKLFYKASKLANTSFYRTSLGIKLLNKCKTQFLIHKKKCHRDKECYCQKYLAEDFDKQYQCYIKKQESKTASEKQSKIRVLFPLLYDLFEDLLLKKLHKTKQNINHDYYLVCSSFYSRCALNNSKSFYFLEEFIFSHINKASFILKVQIEILKKNLKDTIKKNYKYISHNNYQLFASQLMVKNIMKYIQIEKYIKSAFGHFFDFLITLPSKEVNHGNLIDIINNFSHSMNKYHQIINLLVLRCRMYNKEKCLELQLTSKLSIYYIFFHGSIPSSYFNSFKLISSFDDLLNLDTSKQIILSFSKTKQNSSELQIEYLSDSLYVSLGYDNRNDIKKIHKISDILSIEAISNSYEEEVKKKIFKNYNILEIPDLLLTEKNNNYLQIYGFSGVTLITNSKLYVYGKLQDQNKYDSCFVLVNDIGNIIGVSELFTKMFFLNPKIIRSRPLNIFIDVLKITNLEQQQQNNMKIDLISLYENITNLNSNLMLENNQEEYSKLYYQAKEAILNIENDLLSQNLKKNIDTLVNINISPCSMLNKDIIPHYVVILQLTKKIFSLHFFHSKKFIDFKFMKKTTGVKLNSSLQNKEIFTMTKLKSDMDLKFNLIIEQCFVALHNIYGICMFILNKFTTSNIIKNGDKVSKTNIFKIKLNTTQTIRCHTFVGLSFLTFCFFSCLFVYKYKEILFSRGESIIQAQLNLIVAKKIATSITSAVIGLQTQVNGLQRLTYDNGFSNDYEYHLELLNNRINDFLDMLVNFKQIYYSKEFQSNNFIKQVDQFLYFETDYIVMKTNYEQSTKPVSISTIFNFLHIKLFKLNEYKINPISFNNTSKNYFIQGKTVVDTQDYVKSSGGDAVSVFIIENAMTNINYSIIKLINFLEGQIEKTTKSNENLILIIILVCSGLILCFMIYQGVAFYLISTELYVKWFINYCIVKYFSLFLLEKLNILRTSMNFATIKSLNQLNLTRISTENSGAENKEIEEITNSIDSDSQLVIIPFIPALEEIDGANPKIKRNLVSGVGITFKTTIQINDDFSKQRASLAKSNFQSLNKVKSAKMTKQPPKIRINNTNSTLTTNMTLDNFIPNGTKIPYTKNSNLGLLKLKKIIDRMRIKRLTLLVIITLLYLVAEMGNMILLFPQFSLLSNYSVYKTITLLRMCFFHDALVIYEISVLKNTPLTFNYDSQGYLNTTKSNDSGNNTHHEVFNEIVSNFYAQDSLYKKALSNGKEGSLQKTLSLFDEKLHTNESCDYIVNFFVKNKEITDIPLFTSLEVFEPEKVSQNCKEIGRGFNEKGFSAAVLSLMNYISNKYKDFISNENRDEEFNAKLFQEPNLETYQVNTNRMLELLFFDFEICLIEDFNNKKKYYKSFDYVYIGGIIMILVFITILYYYKLVYFYWRIDKTNLEMEKMLYHTINY